MFESPLPWASLERSLTIITVLQKLILSVSYAFEGKTLRSELNLLVFLFGVIIVYQRLSSALIFHKSIHYMTAFYECFLTWAFLTVSIHDLSGTELTIGTVMGLSLAGAVSIMFLLLITEYRQHQIFWQMSENPDKMSQFAG